MAGITVGMTASLTGRYSHPGSQALDGVKAWIADISRRGGIMVGRSGPPLPVRLVHHDDGGDPRRCAELVERLITDDRVDILLGPYSSGLSISAAKVARQHGRALWNHGGAAEGIYGGGSRWVVGVLTPASAYFRGVVDFLAATRGRPHQVAIVSSSAGAFPREVATGAEGYCSQGVEEVLAYEYQAGTSDFRPILKQIAQYKPDLVLAVGRIEDDLRFARQLVDMGSVAANVGLIVTPLAAFGEALGDSAEGFLGPSQWEPGIIHDADYGPPGLEVLRSLTRQRPHGVDYPMAQGYAGCLVAQRCIEEAGSLDNGSLRDAAGRLDFTTFYGRFRIDATGRQVGHVMPVVQWSRGRKVVVWPPEMAAKGTI